MYLQNIDHEREAKRLADVWREGDNNNFSLWWTMWNGTQRVPGLRTRFKLRVSGVYAYIPDLFTQWDDMIDVNNEVVSYLKKCGAESYTVDSEAEIDDMETVLCFYARSYSTFPSFIVAFRGKELCIHVRDTALLEEHVKMILCFAAFAESYLPDEVM